MKTQNAIFGRSRKSFGSATAYTMNGQNIVRTKPIAVANPRTDAQTAQRVRFNAFTKTANALPEDELNALIPDKEVGRNRRTTLQAQLAPAYGAQLNSDPTAAQRIIPTFDYTKLGDVGTGEVGYIGDLVTGTLDGDNIAFTSQATGQFVSRVTNTSASDSMCAVVMSEDGCVLRVIDLEITLDDLDGYAASDGLTFSGGNMFAGHGTTVKAWVVKKIITSVKHGSGVWYIAKRNATKGHNVVVQQ